MASFLTLAGPLTAVGTHTLWMGGVCTELLSLLPRNLETGAVSGNFWRHAVSVVCNTSSCFDPASLIPHAPALAANVGTFPTLFSTIVENHNGGDLAVPRFPHCPAQPGPASKVRGLERCGLVVVTGRSPRHPAHKKICRAAPPSPKLLRFKISSSFWADPDAGGVASGTEGRLAP